MFIKRWLQAKKCLVVLDNLEHINQFEALCGERDWFGEGSRLILTTREAHVLKRLKKDESCEVQVLHHEESLQLFSIHAFGESVLPKGDFIELLNGIVDYCGGLPLALKVLGAYLYDKSKEEWISAFEKLKKIPNKDVQAKLKISYDGLPDDNIKSLFLDLVCFSKQVYKETILSIGDFSTIGIRDMADRCLINCDGSWISMHSLIREMGREIIRLESPKNPGERSRLWCSNDIHDVLKEQKGTKKIEVVVFNSPMKNRKYNTKAFKNMEKLRFLHIDEVHLHGNFKHLRNKMLRCLEWNHCPLEYIPSSCFFEKLVRLDMWNSKIKEFRAPLKCFPCLEILNLDESKHLTRTPDFSGSQNLRKLSFGGCSSLVKVHSSIGELGKLVNLDFYGCSKLKKLPNSLGHLSSLQYLNLTGSSKLLELPANFGNLTSLQKLLLMECNINVLSSNLSHLFMLQSIDLSVPDNLEVLPNFPPSVKDFSLSNCKNLKVIQELPPNLEKLYLDGCENLEIMLPKFPPNLETISLYDCEKLKMLPELPLNLKGISLDGFLNLEKLPELPRQLEVLHARNCESMEKVPNLSYCTRLKELDLTGCRNLKMLPKLPHQLEGLRARNCNSVGEVPNLLYYMRLEELDLTGCRKLKEIRSWGDLSESIIKEVLIGRSKLDFRSFRCSLTCNEIPSWITSKEVGSSICIQCPLCNSEKYTLRFLGFISRVVFKPRALQYLTICINGFRVHPKKDWFQLEVEEISYLVKWSRSYHSDDEFCAEIKAGEVMKIAFDTLLQKGMVKKIRVGALYRDIDGLPQFVPITKLG